MNQWIPYLIKSASILFILLVYYKLFLRKQTFFQLNRLYLLGALVIATITPFISIEIHTLVSAPVSQHPLRTYMSNLLDEVYVIANYTTDEVAVDHSQFNILLITYWLGVLFFILRYMYAFIQILSLKYRNPHRHFHGLNIIILPEQQPAFSYFNNLFISPSLNREDRRKIFAHEKIHIRQYHSLDLLLAEIVCISNWFNPLVWIFKNAIMENHEYIADHQVIRRFHTGSYLDLLIRQTFRGAFSFTNYFSCSNLKKRTIMMTKKQSRKFWVLSFIPITALLVTLLYGFTCNKTVPASLPIVLPELTEPAEPMTTPDFRQQEKDTLVFIVVDKMPSFPGGNVQKWISQNIKYPVAAVEQKIQGKVYVQFIIEKDGSIGDVKVVRGVDPLLDQEAVRVVKSMPQWQPGSQRGKLVRVSYTLPIYFALSPSKPASKLPEEIYKDYVNYLEEIEKKIQDPSLLNEKEKKPIGTAWAKGETDNQKAYTKMLSSINKEKFVWQTIYKLMDSLNFSDSEKEKIKEIHRQKTEETKQLMQSVGPDNFIQKFSALSSFEINKPEIKALIALKKNLTPEHFKEVVKTLNNPVIAPNSVFSAVEVMPQFPWGNVQRWISQHVKYPTNAVKNRIQGKVYVQFIIEKDGSISDIKVLRGVSPELDQEAMRVVRSMPRWKPGIQKGKPVRVSYTLPINFRLS